MDRSIRRTCAVLGTGALLALGAAWPALGDADRTASLQPEQVRTVQRALRARGYEVALSGSWDDDTRGALGAFQAANALPATGNLDPATTRALGVDPAAVTPVAGRSLAQGARGSDPAVSCDRNDTVDCTPGP